MRKLRQIRLTAMAAFGRWRRSPQVWLAFGLGFVACFLLSNKVILFARAHGTALQLCEPFIWTFGDARSILLISLCLLLLFGDMPHLGSETPLFLMRTGRGCWFAGQVVYLTAATALFAGFILLATCVLAGPGAYTAGVWSDTAAVLGYSGLGESLQVPALVKVLELTFPYACAAHVFGLLLGYSLTLAAVIFLFNLCKSRLGMAAGMVYSGYGFLLTPQGIVQGLGVRDRTANLLCGWLSPLNHAAYPMHSFGFDGLPRLWVSYCVFAGLGSLLFALAFLRVRWYSFNFTGTER